MFTSIVLSQSINLARDSLWRRLPPVVVIDVDFDVLSESGFAEMPQLTIDIINPIVELPYVRTYDIFNGTAIYSRELERVLLDFQSDRDLDRLAGYPVMRMELNGVTNPDVIDIETGMYELVLGRTFSLEEMNPADPRSSVAMISYQLAELNNLELGSIITLENNFYKYMLMDYQHYWGHNPDEHIVDYEIYSLEVIGMFDPVVIPDFGNNLQEVYANNFIIVPLSVVHSAMDFLNEFFFEDYRLHGFDVDFLMASEAMQRNTIFLYDAADIPAFIDAAQDLLPHNYKVATFSNSVLAIERLDNSMIFFQDLALQVLLGTVGLSIVALGLTVSLFLRDRKNEIGIYLALGEKKVSIVKQILIETLLPAIGGIILSLFLGSLVANSIGREMLINELIAGQDFNLDDYGWSNAGAQFQWFMEDRIDILIENYEVTLDARAVTLFWSVSMVTVLISTIFPIIYLMRLEPKEILTFSRGS